MTRIKAEIDGVLFDKLGRVILLLEKAPDDEPAPLEAIHLLDEVIKDLEFLATGKERKDVAN